MVRRAIVVAALLAATAPAAAQTASEPAAATGIAAPAVVPAADLRSRPLFRSGTRLEALPELIALAEAGRFGQAAATATVTPDGKLVDIAMAPSTGDPAIDATIVRALQGWQMSSPLDKAGARVATTVRVPVMIGRSPKRLAGPVPTMPQAAKDAFHNGKVVIDFTIDPAGVPGEVSVKTSSRSDLLDQAALGAVMASRFAPPLDLQGKPTSFKSQLAFGFSQLDREGSYIGSLQSLRCREVAGETDWWIQAHPGERLSMEFYHFMGGLAFLATDSLGWGKLGLVEATRKHQAAWEKAIKACREKPEAKFFETYRKG